MSPQPDDGIVPETDPFFQIVQHLANASQWDRLLQMAKGRLEQWPEDDTAHRSAALALIRLRRADEAEIHVAFLLRENPEHAFHQELAAQAAMQRGYFRQAEEHLRAGLAVDPDKPALHRLMASVKGVFGCLEESHQHARRVMELEGDNVHSWILQDIAWEADSQDPNSMSERIQALEKALAHNPEQGFLLWRVGRVLLKLEQPAAARVWLSRAVAADPLNKTFAADWRLACERSHLVYRCLSYPWHSWQYVRKIFRAARMRPDIWPHVLVLCIFWIFLLPWWLLSWVCLAPLGLLARYFMMLHPAFDFRWPPRRWLHEFSTGKRAGFMGALLLLVLAGLCFVIPRQYVLGWAGLALVQLYFQVYYKSAAIQSQQEKHPCAPSSWLNPEERADQGSSPR